MGSQGPNISSDEILRQGISEPLFYRALVYTLKIIVGKPNFSYKLKRYLTFQVKRVRYNMAIMQQSACLIVNPITVDSYGFLFNCTTVGKTSDLITALT